MNNVLRLGLAAAALGTAVLAPSASAACEYVATAHASVALCDSPGSVRVYQSGGDVAVCWHGHAPYQVWVASPTAGIAPYDQVQVVVSRAGLDRDVCAAVLQ